MKQLIKLLRRNFKTDAEFLSKWELFSDNLMNNFEKKFYNEELVEDFEDLDQLVKITFYNGKTFIINRQVPNHEIWYSSPLSGPSHFKYDSEKDIWINKKNQEFYEVFNKDMEKLTK
jgi:iron donor protein CyaY